MRIPDEARLLRGRAAVIDCPLEGCRICVSACGFSAIRPDESGRPFSDPSKCVGCGGCAAICPERAIRLLRLTGGGAEVTLPCDEPLPELEEIILVPPLSGGEPVPAKVTWAMPKRPKAVSALVRASVPASYLELPAEE